jgi:hypothetical protein
MKQSKSWLSLLAKMVLYLMVLPALLGVGLAVMFQAISLYVQDPFRIPVALVAFVAYIYFVGRWVLRLKTRPILPPMLKRKLLHILASRHGLTPRSSGTPRKRGAP